MPEELILQNICPEPIQELIAKQDRPEEASQIWYQELTLSRKQHYQVYAPSGKGKSSFIHILYGLRKDYAGEAFWGEQKIRDISRQDWVQLRQKELSIVFQDLRLFPELSARENIQVKMALYPDSSEEEMLRMAETLGVLPILDKPAALLSFGERQRIAIIRALVGPFHFLLLDEPFSHLDEGNIAKASDLIMARCHENQAALIMTSLGYDYGLDFDQKLLL